MVIGKPLKTKFLRLVLIQSFTQMLHMGAYFMILTKVQLDVVKFVLKKHQRPLRTIYFIEQTHINMHYDEE